MTADLAQWPGRERRSPSLSEPARLVLRPLARGIAHAVERHLAPLGDDLAVLDVGCGVKPYLPLFASVASEYVGVDVEAGPQVDVVSPAEALPFDDASFDAVLSSQALEHVADPAQAVREMHRVLRPGGIALISVPATAVYHPCPTDYWRWTQEGLSRMLDDNGDWEKVELQATGGTAACFGYLVAFYLNAFLYPRSRPLRNLVVAVTNIVFGALDRVLPLHHPRTYTLIATFLAVARKPAG